MKQKLIVIQMFFYLIAPVLYAQSSSASEKIMQLDRGLTNCHNDPSNHSTLGMVNCEETYLRMWEKEMNKVFYKLFKKSNPALQSDLLRSQIRWTIFRRAQSVFSGKFYHELQGTMFFVVIIHEDLEIVRARTIQLLTYYEYL